MVALKTDVPPHKDPAHDQQSSAKMEGYDRAPITQKMRVSIASGQSYQCNLCTALFIEPWHIDHTIPLCEGGKDDETNMQALCVECHKEKTCEEARTRTGKVLKAASKRLLSKRLHDFIFERDIEDDVIVDAKHVFGALCRLEKGMDQPQVERFLALYGLTRQHSALVVVQAVFAESFGIEVKRRSQRADDPCYNKLMFSFKHVKQAALDFVDECTCDDAGDRFDERGVDFDAESPHMCNTTDVLDLVDVTLRTTDMLTLHELFKLIKKSGSRIHVKEARESLISMGCKYHRNLAINGLCVAGFMGARIRKKPDEPAVQVEDTDAPESNDEWLDIFEVTKSSKDAVTSQRTAEVLREAGYNVSKQQTRKRLEAMGSKYTNHAKVDGKMVRGFIRIKLRDPNSS